MTVKIAIQEELKKRLQNYKNLDKLENRGFSDIRRILNLVGGPLPADQFSGLLTKAEAMAILAGYLFEWGEIRRAFLSGEREEVYDSIYIRRHKS